MRPQSHRSHSQQSHLEQGILNFSPIEATAEERPLWRREIDLWTREEAAEEFPPLPGESLQEFFAARERHLQDLDTFGPLFPPRPVEPSEAWQMVHGQVVHSQGRTPPAPKTRQLKLPFDPTSGAEPDVPNEHPPTDPLPPPEC